MFAKAALRTAARAAAPARRLSTIESVVVSPHFKVPRVVPVVTVPKLPGSVTKNTEADYTLSHAVYTKEEVDKIEITHLPPTSFSDRVALAGITALRSGFDLVTGYGDNMTTEKYTTRIVFLETVAGVPGMVAAMARHLRSLRTMKRDFGWVHTLLEEAENERMHLLTFTSEEITDKKPSLMTRSLVLLGQGVFWNFYFAAYLLAPRTCHRFVGYLEEEAVKTYTHAIADLDAGKLPQWEKKAAPEIAKKYWRLAPEATMRDLLLAVRADEAAHRDVNHCLSILPDGVRNPFS